MDLLRDLLGGHPVGPGDLPDELDGLVEHLQLQQPEQGVHTVRVLMVLRAQRVDETTGGVQLAAELLQLGTVTQRGHGAAVVGGHPVGDQHPLPPHGHQVRPRHPAREDIGGAARAQRRVQRLADDLRAEAQQPLRLVVEQPDAAAAVQGHHTLADAVQHRLALREQRGDVREGEVPGLLLHPPGDQVRRQRPDRQRPARVGEQAGDRVEEPRPDAVVLDAD